MSSKNILITGANRGIGFAIAQSLAQDLRLASPTLIVTSRQLANAETAVAELQQLSKNQAVFSPLQLDVTDDTSIAAAVQQVSAQHSHLDVLINNAGIAPGGSSLRASFAATLDTNVSSVAVLTDALLPLLLRALDATGRVINVSSARGSLGRVVGGENPPTLRPAYGPSKAALNMLTAEFARVHPETLAAYVVNPGWCRTDFNGRRGPREPVEGARSVVELAVAEKGRYASPGFWEWEEGMMREVPW